MTLRYRLLCCLLLAASAVPAQAENHLIKVREVYVGPAANPNAQYVMLQMYASGENQVGNHNILVYGANGSVIGAPFLGEDVPSGANQAYILIATPEAEALFGIEADFRLTTLLPPAGGKICWEDLDCFSWGNYAGGDVNPSPSGNPFNPAAGLTPDTAVRRKISGGANATRLEAADDTNDSAADFEFAAAPDPVNNLASLTQDCGGGGGYGGGDCGGYGSGALNLPMLALLLAVRRLRRLRPT